MTRPRPLFVSGLSACGRPRFHPHAGGRSLGARRLGLTAATLLGAVLAGGCSDSSSATLIDGEGADASRPEQDGAIAAPDAASGPDASPGVDASAVMCDGLDASQPLHIHMLSGSREYESEASLMAYSASLQERYRISVTASWGEDKGDYLPNLGCLDTADLLLIFVRRQKLAQPQLERFLGYAETRRPIIGLRTAGHAFSDDDRNDAFGFNVLGIRYEGHGSGAEFDVVDKANDHPVLEGVGPFTSEKVYYGIQNPNAILLQEGYVGSVEAPDRIEPVTVVNEYRGGRVFFTSLGVPKDFNDPNFLTMLDNAIFWTTEQDRAALTR